MARPKKSVEKLDISMPLRISRRMSERVKRMGKRLAREDGDTLRFSADIGLAFLEIIGGDVASAVLEKVLRLAREKEGGAG
jgi:hypothetical protein